MNSYYFTQFVAQHAFESRFRRMFRLAFPVVLAMVMMSMSALGQLSGTYTIGGASPNYASIEAAITALNVAGVSGPVSFRIRSGTYTPPGAGYVLRGNPGMSATNTVTFKPDAGATVTISGTTDTLTAVFTIDGGKHYIIDGSNAAGGTTRNMTIRQLQSVANPVIWMRNDADLNIVRNCVIVGNGNLQSWSYPTPGTGSVFIGITNTTSGNDSNVVENNRIGDSTGVYRSNIAVAIQGFVAEIYVGNEGNAIVRNDIVNFGTNGGYYSIGVVLLGNQDGTLIEGNDIHMTVATPSPYTWGIAQSTGPYGGGASGTVIKGNRVYKLASTYVPYSNIGIFMDSPAQGGPGGGSSFIVNNMVSMVEDGDYSYTGIQLSDASGFHQIYHNSIYLGGAAGATATHTVSGFAKSSTDSVIFKNNLINSTRTGGRGLNFGMYLSDTNGYVGDYNIVKFNTEAKYYTAYVSENHFTYAQRLTFNDYQSHSAQDAHSFEATVPFVDAANGNLHIDTNVVFTNGGRGTPIADVPLDFDNEFRSLSHPDIGADEANPIQDGIRLLYPNGGATQQFGVGDTINVRFTVNRALNIRVDFSTNGGANWTTGTVRAVTTGDSMIAINAPASVTSQARVRVVNVANTREADTSNQNFNLVQPILTIVSPNGANTLVPTDHARIEFNAQYLSAATRLRLDYSTDDGATWNAIDTNVHGVNAPATNTYDWVVPAAPSNRVRVRVKVADRDVADSSDAPLTITERPSLSLTAPATGGVLYVGDKVAINWQSVMTTSVRLTYSIDGGTTWLNVVPNGAALAAATGTYLWTVPNTPAEGVRLKITNVERGRFEAIVAPVTIRLTTINVLAPNGGEQFESGAPVTVTWQASNAGPLRLEYSNDNGVTWQTVAGTIAPESGSYTFTPSPEATRFAFVRLVDPARLSASDRSDRAFEILKAPSITILSPAGGDLITRNSSTLIVWDAARIAGVDIAYSANDGKDWQTVATNVAGASGNYAWNVPDAETDKGRIRITETGGGVTSETGTFSIVTRAPIAIRVLAPNGGETYRVGDTVQVRWSASSITTPVSVAFSSDGGSTWQTLGTPMATDGAMNWIIASAPGNAYRVRVGTGNIVDVSDAVFTVVPRQDPAIAVVAPNGGERFTADSVTEIRWSARNIGGDVTIEFSPDGGTLWSAVQTVKAAAGSVLWTVPATETERGLIRITDAAGGVSDVSDAQFAIVRRAAASMTLVAPNGGERWLQNSSEVIRWNAAAASTVNLEYSIDGGATWIAIRTELASTQGANEYSWLTPALAFDADNSVLVRIVNAADASIADVSDGAFSLLHVAGLDGVTTGLGEAHLLGNFPNPFAARTEIRWIQYAAADVEIRLYSGNGNLLSRYSAGHREQGEQRFGLPAIDLPSGIYAYELNVGGKIFRSMMMVTR